jgi:hypothetical protein
MAGSLLGTILIVAALVAFVPLVSLNAPDVWPTPGLGSHDGAAGGDVGVGAAVVARAKHPEAGGLVPNPASGSSVAVGTAIGVVPVSSRGLHTERFGGTEPAVQPNGTVAVSPASAEVVARNPGSPASDGADAAVPPPIPTETGNAPSSAATGGEHGELGETPSTAPVPAGVGTEAPESQPPERPVSVPPPPTGGSTEGGGASNCPDEGSEDEAVQTEDGDSPAVEK